MITLSVFIISLALIIFSLVMKSIELKRGRKIFLASLFAKSDILIYRFLGWLKNVWNDLTWSKIISVTNLIISWVRSKVYQIKSRLDHKHAPFFVKPGESKNKGSVSFFLKNVSDYKKTLREDK